MSKGVLLKILGKLAAEPTSLLGSFGKIHHTIIIAKSAAAPIVPNVIRHPSHCPIIRPNGSPSTVASALPMDSSPKALVCRSLGATRTTRLAVIDQNTACASAINARPANSMAKLCAITDTACPPIKITNNAINSLRRSIRAVTSMAGSDKIATIQA